MEPRMEKKRRRSSMLVPTIIMGVLAVTLVLIGYSRGQGEHILGLKSALNMTITVLPMLVFAFTMAGLIQVLLPRDIVSKWVGLRETHLFHQRWVVKETGSFNFGWIKESTEVLGT